MEKANWARRDGCSVDGCEGKHHARGFCRKHYHEFMHLHNPRPCKAVINAETGERCGGPHRAKGLCALHYQRARRFRRADGSGFELSEAEIERRREHGRKRRAMMTPEERSAMVAKGNHSRRLLREGRYDGVLRRRNEKDLEKNVDSAGSGTDT